jgi:pyridoxamine 5'-phosphate oxidase
MAALDESIVGDEPLSFFRKWFKEALDAEITEVNAMTLATCGSDGWPHARIVLLKGLENGGFTFFTNYNSSKGADMLANSQVSLLFFWKELERQVRIEGIVEKVEPLESDVYFNSRPDGSKIGAWASPQSQVIADRSVIEKFEANWSLTYPSSNGSPNTKEYKMWLPSVLGIEISLAQYMEDNK